jgi:hypothetical protein
VASPGQNYLTEDDLLRFLDEPTAERALGMFEGAERGRITKQALISWVRAACPTLVEEAGRKTRKLEEGDFFEMLSSAGVISGRGSLKLDWWIGRYRTLRRCAL